MKTEIKQEANGITISLSKEEIKMEDLVQSAINYLYDRLTKEKHITDDEVKLFEILYKD